ncbi:hypothetical protein NDU88_006666 [Pleurodeles waltl]|uniref:Uncharacterized protein n=1 Tax=Pleurodeles waltl TaxID=8319 RepID=A0AAV7N1I2_PLEWA|nr:hypothetical protein NDU88_006666 [Pleurodeles waltl]
MRVRGKQEKSKDYFDRVKSVKDLEVKSGHWVLVKKPMRINKGDSKFSQPVKVEKISRRAVCLQDQFPDLLSRPLQERIDQQAALILGVEQWVSDLDDDGADTRARVAKLEK